MHRRRDEGHPRDNLRLRFEIPFRQQTRVGEGFGEVKENCGDLGQRATVDQESRHLAFGVEREKSGSAIFFLRQGNRTAFERGADLVERDVRRHGARARGEVER